jgi:hypothetical protein
MSDLPKYRYVIDEMGDEFIVMSIEIKCEVVGGPYSTKEDAERQVELLENDKEVW